MSSNTRMYLRVLGWLVLTMVVGIVGIGSVYLWRMLPPTADTRSLPGLIAPATISRDAADVPHIRAESNRDAWFTLGYLHAQERGWQLEFNRRLMHGRLSEVLGPATLELDKLIRTLGIMRAAKQQIQNLPPDVIDTLQAYSDGISAFRTHHQQGNPPEFAILGITPGGWDPVDSVGWSLMMALDLGGNWGTEFARLSAAATLDNTMLWQLFPPYEGEQPATTVNLPKLYRDLGIYRNHTEHTSAALSSQTIDPPPPPSWPQTLISSLGHPSSKGSNNWVVAGNLTTSGLPLLANDPHLDLTAPAIWYMASLQSPQLQVAGATIPGLPFVVIGRTAGAAWTFTNTGPDVQDLYLEQIHPENPSYYRVPDGWEPFETHPERILVKGQPDVTITVRNTRHGPVLSDIQDSHQQLLDTKRYVLALRWSALEANNQTITAGVQLNQANTVAELIAAGSLHHSPMQSVLMADTKGTIALQVMGRAPLRHPNNDLRGVAPAPGWDSRYDWIGWTAYADNPQEVNPTQGWIATANQRVHPANYHFFIGQEWHAPYRYQRIATVLEATKPHSLEDMARLQSDELSLATLRLLPFAQAAAAQLAEVEPQASLARQASQQLASFDGVMAADRPEPLIFVAWADHLTRRLLEPKIGAERLQAWYGDRHFRRTLEMILEQDLRDWCQPLSCAEHSRLAMQSALQNLTKTYGDNPSKWTWGEAHPAISVHRPFGDVPWLADWFNVQVPSGGDHFTVNVGQYRAKGDLPYANRQAASLRILFDLADLDQSRFIYQTGQSGLVISPRYRDMRDEWATFKYRPLNTKPATYVSQRLLMP